MKTENKFYYEISYRYFSEPIQMDGLTSGVRIFENEDILQARDNAFIGFKEFIYEILKSKSLDYISDNDAYEKIREIFFPPNVLSLKIPKFLGETSSSISQSLTFDVGIAPEIINPNIERKSQVFLNETQNFHIVNIRPYDLNQYIRLSLISVQDFKDANEVVQSLKQSYCIHAIEFSDLSSKYLISLFKEASIFKKYTDTDELRSRLVTYTNFNRGIKQKYLPTPHRYVLTLQEVLDRI